ncbi:hypothetical protein MMC25_006914 [Agyrium rufum]|nr:hypothetical protein [Agyrium rufum]
MDQGAISKTNAPHTQAPHMAEIPSIKQHLSVLEPPRRRSFEQIILHRSDPQSGQEFFVSAPPRPASAFARSHTPRPLSNIPESLGSEDADNPVPTTDDQSVVAGDDPETKLSDARQPTATLHRPHSRDADTLRDRGVNRSTKELPIDLVPRRISSLTHLSRRSSDNSQSQHAEAARKSSQIAQPIFRNIDFQPRETPDAEGPRGRGVPSNGQSTSPVRSAAQRLNAISSDNLQSPSRTFVRPVRPIDLLEAPELSHARISLDIRIAAPLFIGGGTVEGHLVIRIDGGKHERRPLSSYRHGNSIKSQALSLGRISVDVIGIEMAQGRKHIFRNLAIEIIDEAHPPPSTMMPASRSVAEAFWEVAPSLSVIPFCISLPVKMGPPPYTSKHAVIRYVLSATLAVKIEGKQYHVRRSLPIDVLTPHNPEKALVNLPFPLTADEELHFSKQGPEYRAIKLTAGVHRQTWVSGILLFVDVHVSNSSTKIVRKLEIQLEKVTTFYARAAASTKEQQGDFMRVPDQTEREIVAKMKVKKKRHGWEGILPQSQDVRTLSLVVPSGLVTVDTGRFFGVRYFISVLAYPAYMKPLQVQIPITIIHPNSLDIPPNSLAQVASAIESRLSTRPSRKTAALERATNHLTSSNGAQNSTDRTRIFPHSPIASRTATDGLPLNSNPPDDALPMVYRYTPGAPFVAARRKSIEQMEQQIKEQRDKALGTLASDELDEVTRVLEGSPRKYAPQRLAVPSASTDRHGQDRGSGESHVAESRHRRVRSKTHTRENSAIEDERAPTSSRHASQVEARGQPTGQSSSFRENGAPQTTAAGARARPQTSGPRLMRSTSGLGFTSPDASGSGSRSTPGAITDPSTAANSRESSAEAETSRSSRPGTASDASLPIGNAHAIAEEDTQARERNRSDSSASPLDIRQAHVDRNDGQRRATTGRIVAPVPNNLHDDANPRRRRSEDVRSTSRRGWISHDGPHPRSRGNSYETDGPSRHSSSNAAPRRPLQPSYPHPRAPRYAEVDSRGGRHPPLAQLQHFRHHQQPPQQYLAVPPGLSRSRRRSFHEREERKITRELRGLRERGRVLDGFGLGGWRNVALEDSAAAARRWGGGEYDSARDGMREGLRGGSGGRNRGYDYAVERRRRDLAGATWNGDGEGSGRGEGNEVGKGKARELRWRDSREGWVRG